jgi:hypothetical protein
MTLRFSSLLIATASLLSAIACSAGAPNTGSTARGAGGSGSTTSGTGGSGNALAVGDGTTTMRDPTDTRDLATRPKTCDAMGNCTCLRLAMLGTLTSAAVDSDTTAFVDWLNDKSMGTALVTNITAKPTLDATFLGNYDVLIVANVSAWAAFSAAEQAAIKQWVEQTGGGIITLTGFNSLAAEPATSSQLISFAGLGYGSTPAAPASGEGYPVYYKGGTTNLKMCLNWTGSSGGITHSQPFITTPVKFTPQTGTLEKLTFNLDYVGAFIGWPVSTIPQGAVVVATDPVTGGNMAVAYEDNGKGRIFAFGDEWVVFSNEWAPTGNPNNTQMDQYNPCWEPASGTAAGFFQSVETLYQTKQFWYDAINWVAPPTECSFTVTDPDVVVK